MTQRDILLAFKAGTLSKDEVRQQLRALHTPVQRQPLSEGQQGLWALQKLAPQMSTYNVPLCFRVGAELDVVRLQRACRLLLERFPSLTTVFGEEDGVPFQIEQPSQPLYFVQEDISALASHAVLPQLRGRAVIPFSLEEGPLMRVHLCSRATAAGVEHLLLITVHHIIFDGASVVPLVTTLFDAYRDLAAGTEPTPAVAPAPYADFVAWEQRLLTNARGAEHLAYWAQQLAGPLPTLDLPTNRQRWEPGQATTVTAQPRHFEGDTITQRLSPELTAALRAFAASQGMNLPVVFLGLFTLLLHRYTDQDEVIVGMPTIGRPQEQFDSAVGYFVNMLAMRVHTPGNRAFTDFLGELQLTLVDGLDHAAYPFPALVRALNMPRHDGPSPVFQVAFVYQSFLRSGGLQEVLDRYRDTLAIELVTDLHQESVYELALEIFETAGSFDLSLKYQPELYDAATIAQMVQQLVTLAEGVSREPERALDAYALLSPAETARLIGPLAGGVDDHPWPAHLPADACLHEVFERQARATPDALAVTCDTHALTYAELEARSTTLALYLQQQGVQPEQLVGLSLEPSLEMLVGLLGILKAGGAYVPLDPTYPPERLVAMVRDSQVALVLTQAAQVEKVAALGQDLRTIALDTDWHLLEQDVRMAQQPALHHTVQAQHLAYVIYTSGSTGTPKGTLVQHNHVVRLFATTERYFHFHATDVWTLFHSLSFDFSVWELWGALLYGGRLVLVPPAVRQAPREVYALVQREQVTVLNQIPSAFMQLIPVSRAAAPREHSLRYVIFGGEALPMARLQPWFAQCGATRPRLINMYGITETTVHVTYYAVTPADTARAASTIGRALPDLRLYILDRHGQPCPVGMPGEMYVGGQGVTRGYLHQPALTAQRFIASAFEPGTRLYRTGDLARWRPNAAGHPYEIEYLGRLDEQVKVRGFRIELGEIESQMLRHPAIRDCVVIVKERGASTPRRESLTGYKGGIDAWQASETPRQTGGAIAVRSTSVEVQEEHRQLIAYYVPTRPGAVSARQLRQHLQAILPAYMVPAVFVELAALPRTSSGKINRQALRAREVVRTAEGVGGLPGSGLEAQVLAIWQAVLGTTQIGVEEGFFDAGGDSLLLVAVADRMREDLGCDLPLAMLFKYTTIRELSAHIAATRGAVSTGPIQEEVVPPSPWQGEGRGEGVDEGEGEKRPAALGQPVYPDYYQDSLAIVGISCQFPGAADHRAFWQNLCQGKAAGRFFTATELAEFGLAEGLIRDPHFVPLQITIEDKDCFDPAFFNISRRHAALLDPQARLLLLHAWKAIEDAGYRPEQIPQTGVFMSASNTFYQTAWLKAGPGDTAVMESSEAYVAWMFAQGGSIPTMISHKLGLQGPSVFVHTNCSSSLVGLQAACQSLQLNEAEVALVGAAMVLPGSQPGYLHRHDLNFSSDGRCKPFDAAADGMVGGEGVAVVVLKRAVDAIRDRDHIYALLRGISVNNDGADKVGFYAPSINGQARVIQKVLERTGIDAASIGYVEAHGTGTRLGDPVELSALSEVYRRYTDAKQFCGIGSVKSNIGHLDTAAGLAGCIKVVLSLYHGDIPPSIHYEQPNPAINFANSPFYVVDRLSPWASATPHRAALSSFGIGGTNVHAVLEQYPEAAEPPPVDPGSNRRAVLVPLAAKNGARLQAYASELLTFLAAPAGASVALADLAYTFQIGRKPMPARVVFLVSSGDELRRQLQAFVDGTPALEGCFRSEVSGAPASEAFQLCEDDDDLEVMSRKWLGEKKLPQLARLWVRGIDLDWERLYVDEPRASQPRRCSLPTYPFAKERYGWPENHGVAPVATRPMTEESPGGASASEGRATEYGAPPVHPPGEAPGLLPHPDLPPPGGKEQNACLAN